MQTAPQYARDTDDTLLLARLRAGERAAFDELVHRFHLPLKRLAAAMVGDAQAEEVVQEAWLSAIRHLHDFEGRSSLKTWLFTIAGNEARGRLRKAKREVFIDDQPGGDQLFDNGRFLADGHWAQPPGLWHDDSPEALLSHEDFRRCLEKTLQNLPESQSTALMLRDLDELSLEDICNVMAISASNVRVLIHRARARVYSMVEHFEETGTC
jgi:RNA polymerase sigma-70 factor, ECF subfamily